MHRWSILIIVQRDAIQSCLLFCKFTLHVSGVKHTHHQEYTKLQLQPPVLVIFFVQLPPSNMAKPEWTCRRINRQHCVGSRWTVINIIPKYFFFHPHSFTIESFISVFNQLDAQTLFHNKFYFMPLHVSSTCAQHQEVKIALHSFWYHHTYRWPSQDSILKWMLLSLPCKIWVTSLQN